jgi:uncharacterized protein (DUF488 family)
MSPKTSKKKATTRRKRRLIYTIGYEGYTLNEFIDALAHEQISAIIDVRNHPSSHKPGFSKTPLSAALVKQGIEYLHLPQLGIPREIRVRYREESDFRVLRHHLKAPLEQNHQLLTETLERLRKRNVCLMCFEKEPSHCHRSIVAEFLVKNNNYEIHNL